MPANNKSRRCWTRKQGGAYQFTGASISGVNNFGQVNQGSHSGTPDCVAAVKSDTLGFTGSPALPGLQKGGRYAFDLSEPLGGGTPALSGIPQVISIPCEASTTRQSGGAADNVAYFAPTAGYDNQPSGWVGSTGAPVMIQAPYEARAMNPACLKTGGSRRIRKYRSRGGANNTAKLNNKAKVNNKPVNNKAKVNNKPVNNKAKVNNKPVNNKAKVNNKPVNNKAKVNNKTINNKAKNNKAMNNKAKTMNNRAKNNKAKINSLRNLSVDAPVIEQPVMEKPVMMEQPVMEKPVMMEQPLMEKPVEQFVKEQPL